MEAEIEIGIRIDETGQLQCFGLEEVNKRIREGQQVVSLGNGRALMKKTGESNESVRLQFGGFAISVRIFSDGATNST